MARINAFATAAAPKFLKYIVSANRVLEESPLPESLQELLNVLLQIKGGGYEPAHRAAVMDAAMSGGDPERVAV